MKKFLILILLSIFIFTSCSNNNDKNKPFAVEEIEKLSHKGNIKIENLSYDNGNIHFSIKNDSDVYLRDITFYILAFDQNKLPVYIADNEVAQINANNIDVLPNQEYKPESPIKIFGGNFGIKYIYGIVEDAKGTNGEEYRNPYAKYIVDYYQKYIDEEEFFESINSQIKDTTFTSKFNEEEFDKSVSELNSKLEEEQYSIESLELYSQSDAFKDRFPDVIKAKVDKDYNEITIGICAWGKNNFPKYMDFIKDGDKSFYIEKTFKKGEDLYFPLKNTIKELGEDLTQYRAIVVKAVDEDGKIYTNKNVAKFREIYEGKLIK